MRTRDSLNTLYITRIKIRRVKRAKR